MERFSRPFHGHTYVCMCIMEVCTVYNVQSTYISLYVYTQDSVQVYAVQYITTLYSIVRIYGYTFSGFNPYSSVRVHNRCCRVSRPTHFSIYYISYGIVGCIYIICSGIPLAKNYPRINILTRGKKIYPLLPYQALCT